MRRGRAPARASRCRRGRRGASRVDREETIRIELAARDLHALSRESCRSAVRAGVVGDMHRRNDEASLRGRLMPQEKRWRVDCEDERGLPRTALCRAGGQEGCPDVVREKSVGRLGNRTEAVGGPTLPVGGPACGPPTDDDESAPTPAAERERIEANPASIAPCARSASRVPIRRKGQRFSSSSATRSPAPAAHRSAAARTAL